MNLAKWLQENQILIFFAETIIVSLFLAREKPYLHIKLFSTLSNVYVFLFFLFRKLNCNLLHQLCIAIDRDRG
jgi:hypothetical protein